MSEAAEDGRASRESRGETVRALLVARVLAVTGEAGGVTGGVVRTHGLRRIPRRAQSDYDRARGEEDDGTDGEAGTHGQLIERLQGRPCSSRTTAIPCRRLRSETVSSSSPPRILYQQGGQVELDGRDRIQ